MMMEIEDLTIKQIREINSMQIGVINAKSHPYIIGEKYFIRTVTNYYTGILEAVHDQELVINNAAWIVDTGRFNKMLKGADMNEIEPYPDGPVVIGRGAIIDASIVDFDMPRSEK